MRIFSFILLFIIVVTITLNSCVEKCSRNNQIINEECFCIKDDNGNFVDLHYVKRNDGIVTFTAEPSSIKLKDDSVPSCITFSNNMTIKYSEDVGYFRINSNGKEKLWVFETTLGEPNFCKSIYNDGDGNGDGQTPTVEYVCTCNGKISDHCKGQSFVDVTPTSSYMVTKCYEIAEKKCEVSGIEQPCQVHLIKEERTFPLNPNNATLLIVAAKAIEYNGLKYE